MVHPLNILFSIQHSFVPTGQHVSPHPSSQSRVPHAASRLASNSANDLMDPSYGGQRPSLDNPTCSMSQQDLSISIDEDEDKKIIPDLKLTEQEVYMRTPRRKFLIGYQRLAMINQTGLLLILVLLAIIITTHVQRDGGPLAFSESGRPKIDLSLKSELGSARNVTSSTPLHTIVPSRTATARTFTPVIGKRGGADGYDSLIVFGASYCDNGHARPTNLRNTLKPPPYYKGRWTNGYVWNEYLSEVIGPGGKPTMLLNYAIGGATVDNDLNEASAPDLKEQISAFLSDLNNQSVGAAASNGKSLIACWMGLNSVTRIWKSVLKNGVHIRSQSETQDVMMQAERRINATVDGIFNEIEGLIHTNGMKTLAGADFLLLPIPPAELLLVNIRASKGNANALQLLMDLSDSFNLRFAANLETFQHSLSSNQRTFSLDIPTIWHKFVTKPASANLDTVNRPCLSRSGVCKSPASYLYWDNLHPTTHVHEQLASMIYAVIKAA